VEEGVRFEFGRCLGRGGFGEVYEAHMRTRGGVQRTVAVKILRDRVKDVDSAIRRLRDEAHLLAALHHRAIVQVHDLVELDGRIALVTEYLPGADLDHIVREDGRMPVRVALEVLGEVASALHAAYTMPAPGTNTPTRLVHRDIKPANIRITTTGSVKLLDFGIARSPEVDREARTTTGIVVGTVGYFSPERLTEDLPQPADDVYALGCVLYEVVTGLQLYRGMKRADLFRLAFHPDNHAAFLHERLGHPPEGVRFWPALQPLLARVLSSDPEERPSAGELEEACFSLVKDLDGPTLREWSRQRTWQEPSFVSGPFEGRKVASTMGAPDTARTERAAAPPPPSVPAGTAPKRDAPIRPASKPKPRPAPPPVTSGLPWGWLVLGLGIVGAIAGGVWHQSQKAPTLRTTDDTGTKVVAATPVDVPEVAPEPEPIPEPEPEPPPPAPGPVRMPSNPDAEPPRPLPASLDGSKLLTLRSGTILELRDLASPAKAPRILNAAAMKATDVCLKGDTFAVVMGGTVEVRRTSDDTVVDRMRPGGRVVDQVLCLDDGQVVAVSRAPRIGSGGGTGEVVWWTNQGRVRGKLLPPAGVVRAEPRGDKVLVLDGEGGVRAWTGQGSPSTDMVPLRGTPTGVTPSLGGPAWAVSSRTACSIEGTCVQVDGTRGLVTSGVGWVAVAGPDRITVLNGVEGTVVRDIPALPTELFAEPKGTLLVVEPHGVRRLDPMSGAELMRRDW